MFFYGFIGVVLAITGAALLASGIALGGPFILAGLVAPVIPTIGAWYAAKRNKNR